MMDFKAKKTRNKIETVNKSLYLRKNLAEKIEGLAIDNKTSFNNIVVTILEDFFENYSKE